MISGRPRWLSLMHVWLVIRRLQVWPPPGMATFFHGYWSWNTLCGHSLPSADSRRVFVSFWQKNVHNSGQPLRGLSLPSKSVVRKTDCTQHNPTGLTEWLNLNTNKQWSHFIFLHGLYIGIHLESLDGPSIWTVSCRKNCPVVLTWR